MPPMTLFCLLQELWLKKYYGNIVTSTHMGNRQLSKKTAPIIEFGKVNIFKCVCLCNDRYIYLNKKCFVCHPMYMKKVKGFPFKKQRGENEWREKIIWRYNLNLPWKKSQKFYLYLLICQPRRREMKNVVDSL